MATCLAGGLRVCSTDFCVGCWVSVLDNCLTYGNHNSPTISIFDSLEIRPSPGVSWLESAPPPAVFVLLCICPRIVAKDGSHRPEGGGYESCTSRGFKVNSPPSAVCGSTTFKSPVVQVAEEELKPLSSSCLGFRAL